MRPMFLLIASLGILIASPVAAANITRFLPGDSFFFTRLIKKEIVASEMEKSPKLDYGSHWDGGIGCGYAGYSIVEFTDMPKGMKTRLPSAYSTFVLFEHDRDPAQQAPASSRRESGDESTAGPDPLPDPPDPPR